MKKPMSKLHYLAFLDDDIFVLILLHNLQVHVAFQL